MKFTLFRLLKPVSIFRGWVLLTVLLGFLTIGSGIGLLMTSAYIISKAALHPSIADLQLGIVGVRFFGISRGIFRYLERLVSHDLTLKLLARFRVWFYESLVPLAPARLIRYKSADLLTRITSDIESLEHLFIRVLYPPLVAVFISFLMWFLLGIYDLRFAITLIIFFIIGGVLLPLSLAVPARKANRKRILFRSELNVQINDFVRGMQEIKANNQEAAHLSKMKELNQRYMHVQRHLYILSGLQEAVIGLLTSVAIITLFYLAVPAVEQGLLEGVYLAVITLGIITAFEAIVPIPSAFQNLEESRSSGKRLYEIIDAEPEVREPACAENIPERLHLRISNLTFRYNPGEADVLKNISIDLPPGKRLALVGSSGAGKTTIAHILLRFWDYSEGRITLNGTELKAFSPSELRMKFSVVTQDSHIFNDTVRANLLLDGAVSDNTVSEALRAAGLKTRISSFADGLETYVGDFGVGLSGGERQRIALARAFLQNRPIWILDEATAGLDIRNEGKVWEHIFKHPGNPTVLMITHRLTGLEEMDEIICIDAGRIIERGTYRELIQNKSFFYENWLEQTEKSLVDTLHGS